MSNQTMKTLNRVNGDLFKRLLVFSHQQINI